MKPVRTIRIRTSMNSYLFKKMYERNTLPSCTIPDQSMSIKEIVRRFASGLPIPTSRQPLWNDSDEPDIAHMDLADREDYINERADELRALKQKISNHEKNKSKTARSNDRRAEYGEQLDGHSDAEGQADSDRPGSKEGRNDRLQQPEGR